MQKRLGTTKTESSNSSHRRCSSTLQGVDEHLRCQELLDAVLGQLRFPLRSQCRSATCCCAPLCYKSCKWSCKGERSDLLPAVAFSVRQEGHHDLATPPHQTTFHTEDAAQSRLVQQHPPCEELFDAGVGVEVKAWPCAGPRPFPDSLEARRRLPHSSTS